MKKKSVDPKNMFHAATLKRPASTTESGDAGIPGAKRGNTTTGVNNAVSSWRSWYHDSVHIWGEPFALDTTRLKDHQAPGTTETRTEDVLLAKPKIGLACFDLDSTLIKTRSGRVFPKDKTDWQWLGPMVPRRLNQLASGDAPDAAGVKFRIWIFTNQGGLGKGGNLKQKIADWRFKIDAIIRQLAEETRRSVLIVCATGENWCRKPGLGAWEYVFSNGETTATTSSSSSAAKSSSHQRVDWKASFYVGDAAGRPAKEGVRKKDFSVSDLKFAFNTGLRFFTPEQYFLQAEKNIDWTAEFLRIGAFNPRTLFGGGGHHGKDIFRDGPPPKIEEEFAVLKKRIGETGIRAGEEHLLDREDAECSKEPAVSSELVLLIGPPGSGKSTISKELFPSYFCASQDKLGSKEAVLRAVETALNEKKSVVVDNQNRDKATRAAYFDLLKKVKNVNVRVRALHLEIPKEVAIHLNLVRTRCKEKAIPEVVIHSYYKNMQAPQEDEPFAEVSKYTIEDMGVVARRIGLRDDEEEDAKNKTGNSSSEVPVSLSTVVPNKKRMLALFQ
ncbi:unnamed protein product [Amoebophrya sp. A25]|nr:unnamed protein product [Amoebophrya sp. A25]|eukprot:GSA25T00020459001.1